MCCRHAQWRGRSFATLIAGSLCRCHCSRLTIWRVVTIVAGSLSTPQSHAVMPYPSPARSYGGLRPYPYFQQSCYTIIAGSLSAIIAGSLFSWCADIFSVSIPFGYVSTHPLAVSFSSAIAPSGPVSLSSSAHERNKEGDCFVSFSLEAPRGTNTA